MRTRFVVRFIATVLVMLVAQFGFSQDSTVADAGELPYPAAEREPYAYSNSSRNSLWLNPPSNLKTEITYNPETNEYEVSERVGAFETYPGYGMSLNE